MIRNYPIALVFLNIANLVGCAEQSAEFVSLGPRTLSQKEEDRTATNGQKELIDNLGSEDKDKREKAREAILAISSESAEARNRIVTSLLEVVNGRSSRPQLRGSYVRWREAANILGSLKAVEAIDALIKCLDCDDGISGLGPGRYPATLAIISIGDPAISKLAEALNHDRVGVRYKAAEALFEIGGDRAKDILVQEQRRQKDRNLARMIKQILNSWNQSSKHKS